MWNISASSAADSSRGSAKKLRENTSNARCRAASGKRSRVEEVRGADAVEPPVDVAARGRRAAAGRRAGSCGPGRASVKLGLRATKPQRVPRRGARARRAKLSRRPPPALRAGSRAARVSSRSAGSVRRSSRPQVVVLPEEGVETRGSSWRPSRRAERMGQPAAGRRGAARVRSTVTRTPRSASAVAAASPAMPPPTTATRGGRPAGPPARRPAACGPAAVPAARSAAPGTAGRPRRWPAGAGGGRCA